MKNKKEKARIDSELDLDKQELNIEMEEDKGQELSQ